ncbi:unnamed protein product, partial [Rotaria magnacalcarata]
MIAAKSAHSTLSKYESYWKHFISFLKTNKLDVSEHVLISFFFKLFKQGLALRTMSAYRASLADPMFYGFQIDTNSKVFRDFFISCRTRRPITKTLPPQWEVYKVLQYLKTSQFKNNKTISLPALLLKTLFLIALATGSRISEIAHSLCPVECLRNWLDITSEWPNPNNFIWFNAATQKPANNRILVLRFRQLINLSHAHNTKSNFHQIRK